MHWKRRLGCHVIANFRDVGWPCWLIFKCQLKFPLAGIGRFIVCGGLLSTVNFCTDRLWVKVFQCQGRRWKKVWRKKLLAWSLPKRWSLFPRWWNCSIQARSVTRDFELKTMKQVKDFFSNWFLTKLWTGCSGQKLYFRHSKILF